MKIKIILGIIIPVIIIVALTTIASLDIGFTIKKDFVDTLSLNDLFDESGKVKNTIKIADITLENEYFLSKRYELLPLAICLDDKEGGKLRINAGSLQYSEGDYSYQRNDFIYAELSSYPYYGDSYGEARNIQIKSNGKKNIRIFLQPSYEFSYRNQSELLKDYEGYDAILIFEIDSAHNARFSCENVDQEMLDKATMIPLLK